jgi:predicted membrane channel-forming protein YqfA (hemolysin III family)
MINIGYCFSVLSLLPFILIFSFTREINYYLVSFCYFFHTLGNAFLCSTFFAIISKESKVHEQGRNYGIIESADTASFLISSIIVMIYKALNINLMYIILISVFTAAVSWIPYQRFEKLRPKKQE